MRRNSHVRFYSKDVVGKIPVNYIPKRTRFHKHRERMKWIPYPGNRICFGRYALQMLESAWICADLTVVESVDLWIFAI